MEAAKENLAAFNGGEVEEEVEEVEEVEEEEEEEEEEEVEEEAEEEEGGDGEGAGESKKSPGRRIEQVDSAGKELKQHVSGSSSSGKIFVGGVAWDTTEETFTNHFAKYGEITDFVIMKDKHTQVPRGFGFVTFADPSVIDKILEEEHSIDGRVVEVKRTVPREDMPQKGPKSKKIFVGGIPTALTEDEFKEHFSSYGVVVEHQIMVDHSTGRSRGFGFITFESEEPVEKIISEGRMHNLAGKQVEIKKAEPKKAGGEIGVNGRGGGYGGGSYGHGGGSYGYGGGGGYRSAGMGNSYYGGGGGFYGRAGYGYDYGSGAGYVPGYGEPMYGPARYGGGGSNAYSAAAGGYGPAYGGGGGGGYGGGSGRGYGSRYHPYGR